MTDATRRAAFWLVMLAAAGTFALTMGTRQSMGLFLPALNTATGLGLGSISLAFAVGQLCGVSPSRSPARWPTATAPAACCSRVSCCWP